MFADAFAGYGAVLAENAPVLVQGNIIRGADGPRVNVKECYPLDPAVSPDRAQGHVAHQAGEPGPRAVPAGSCARRSSREPGDTRMEFAVVLEGGAAPVAEASAALSWRLNAACLPGTARPSLPSRACGSRPGRSS